MPDTAAEPEEAGGDEPALLGDCCEVGEYEDREEGDCSEFCVWDEGENLKELACFEVGEARGLTVGIGLTDGSACGGRLRLVEGGRGATLDTLAVVEAMDVALIVWQSQQHRHRAVTTASVQIL